MEVIETIYKEGDDIILQVDSLTRISLKDFIAKVVAETKDEMAQDIENLTNANNYYFKKLDEIKRLLAEPYQPAILIQNIKDILEVKD